MIRIAATADLHFGRGSQDEFGKHLIGIHERADFLLLAGDLTQTGHPDEIKLLAKELESLSIPVIAVLGNHDYHSNRVHEITQILKNSGVVVLERNAVILQIHGKRVGIAGAKGFGGGFIGASAADFGEQEMKNFIRHSRSEAFELKRVVSELDTEYKIVLLHYSPIIGTLLGEKKEIYPFLGSYYLAEAVDEGGADIVFHGHAHLGRESGRTPGGTPVRNVSVSVIRHPFNIYTIEKNYSS